MTEDERRQVWCDGYIQGWWDDVTKNLPDRPGPRLACDCGNDRTFIGAMSGGPQAVCCTRCSRFIRWATEAECQ